MRRREFITFAGGAASWPLVVLAQQSERIRHIGILMAFSESDPEAQSWAAGFREELGKLGWMVDAIKEHNGRAHISDWHDAIIRFLRPVFLTY